MMTKTRTVLGRYELREEIGRGGMGIVYQAHDLLENQAVALKELRLDNLNHHNAEEMIARFQREAQTARALQHPGIVRVFDSGCETDRHYLIMELLTGQTLKDLLLQQYPFAEKHLLDLLIQICDALAYAHQQGIVHRDIKPDNILITPDHQIKLMDFGIARMNTTEHFTLQTQAGTMLGTLSYMSPEQLQDSAMVDHRADIFSLGVVLYEIYTGQLPFEGESMGQTILKILSAEPTAPVQHYPGLRPELNSLILRMLNKRRGERFQNMSDIAAELRRLLLQLEQEELSIQTGERPIPDGTLQVKRPTAALRYRLTSENRISGPAQPWASETYPSMGSMSDILTIDHLNPENPEPVSKPLIFTDRQQGISLEVSPDWQEAWLSIDPLYAPEAVTETSLAAFLQRTGIHFGIQAEVLQTAVKQGFLARTRVAWGEPVHHGEDGWLEYLVEDSCGGGPQQREDGSVDFRELNLLVSVPARTPLLLRHPPSEGLAGRDITGKIIAPNKGRDCRLLEGKGTCLAADNAQLLIAAVPGRPVRSFNSVRVEDVIELDEVGVKSGHISFDGSVIVRGNVQSGYRVVAGGDIVIQGSIENAVLEAGGNLTIQGSVFGGQNTRLLARGNILANFVQQAQIECQGSLQIHEGLFHCQVHSLGPVSVGLTHGKGQINGGQISSGHLIQARILGSPSSTSTALFLGVDPIAEARLSDLEEALQINKRKLEENIKSLIYIRTQAQEQHNRQKELEQERTELMIASNTLTDEVLFLREQLKLSSQLKNCKILIHDRIYAGVRLNISGTIKTLDADYQGPLQARCQMKNSREREIVLEYCHHFSTTS